MKTSELYKALEEGKTLVKDYYNVDPIQYPTIGECCMTIKIDKDRNITKAGWGSATYDGLTIIANLWSNPQHWDILEKYDVQIWGNDDWSGITDEGTRSFKNRKDAIKFIDEGMSKNNQSKVPSFYLTYEPKNFIK